MTEEQKQWLWTRSIELYPKGATAALRRQAFRDGYALGINKLEEVRVRVEGFRSILCTNSDSADALDYVLKIIEKAENR